MAYSHHTAFSSLLIFLLKVSIEFLCTQKKRKNFIKRDIILKFIDVLMSLDAALLILLKIIKECDIFVQKALKVLKLIIFLPSLHKL